MPKVRNIIIFIAIAAVFVAIYIFFLKPEPADDATLVSAPNSTAVNAETAPVSGAGSQNGASLAAGDFLMLLLNVKNIKLEDAIFSDPAFQGLTDSSITLEPDGNEGRPNPFAPLGQDIIPAPVPVPTPEPEVEPGEDELLDLLNDLGPTLEEETGGEDDPAAGAI